MADPTGMFDKLAQTRQKKKSVQETESAPEPKQRQRKKISKRSDPNYVQVGPYVPKDLNDQVKRLLVGQDKDFSDLVAELLEEWVKQQTD